MIALIGRQASALAAGQPADWASLRQSLPSLLAGMLPTARPGAASGGVQPDRGGVDPKQLRELRFALGRIQALLEAVAADHHHRAGGEESPRRVVARRRIWFRLLSCRHALDRLGVPR